MPTYGPLDSTISLVVWEPMKGKTIVKRDLRGSISDPWDGQHTESLKEEYFDSPGGIGFIGPSNYPFYLVNAGQDLFFNPQKNLDKGEKYQEKRDDDVEGGLLPVTPTPLTQPPGFSFGTDSDESVLSNIASSVFDSPSPNVSRSLNLDGPSDDIVAISKPSPIVLSSTNHDISKPLSLPLPIKVQLDFSKATFMTSLENDQLPYDLCINVYYNGQLTHSRLVKAGTVRASSVKGNQQSFSGRRVNVELEAPFVLIPIPPADLGSSEKNLSFEQRWNTVNERLLVEADKWGRQGKYATFRTPFGEYLEEISKLEPPEYLRGDGRNGTHAGIIDVVVAMGKSLVINDNHSCLKFPDRKLPDAVCGKDKKNFSVPEEKLMRKSFFSLGRLENEEPGSEGSVNIKRKGVFATLKLEESSTLPHFDWPSDDRDTNSSIKAITNTMKTLARNIRIPETVQELRSAKSAGQTILEISSGHRDSYSNLLDSSMVQQSASSSKFPSSYSRFLAVTNQVAKQPIKERKRYRPNAPKNVPQKRYKGLEKEEEPIKPVSRPKHESFWDVPEFDINKTVSSSTRSHRKDPPSNPAQTRQAQIWPKKDIKKRFSVPKFEHNQYLQSKDDEDISAYDEADYSMLPSSPSPMVHNGLLATSRPGGKSLELFSTPQDHTWESYSTSPRGSLRSGESPDLPGVGMDGTGDVDSPSTKRSGVSFGNPNTENNLNRTTRAGTSFATPDIMNNNLKRKRVSSNVSSTTPSHDRLPNKIARFEVGPDTLDTDQRGKQVTGFGNDKSLLDELNATQSTSFIQETPNSTATEPVLDRPNQKKRIRSLVSKREMKGFLESRKPLAPTNKSFTKSFSETASDISRLKPKFNKVINPHLRATAKTDKFSVSVVRKGLRQIVIHGSKVRDLLIKNESKSYLAEAENDLWEPPKISHSSGMIGVYDQFTMPGSFDILVPTLGTPSVPTKASVNHRSKLPKTPLPHPPREHLPSGMDARGPKTRSQETLAPPQKQLGNIEGGKSLFTSSHAILSSSQDSREKSFVKPPMPKSKSTVNLRLRSSTRTSEGMAILTSHNSNTPHTVETPSTTTTGKNISFDIEMEDAFQLPDAAIAPASTPESDIPLSVLAKRRQIDAPASHSLSTTKIDVSSSIPDKKRKADPLDIGSNQKPKAKFTISTRTTPQSPTLSLSDQTPGTNRKAQASRSVASSDPNWEPTDLCADSVLTYANAQNTSGWAGLEIDPESERVYRSTRREFQGVFRASSILMGVRYVVGVRSE